LIWAAWCWRPRPPRPRPGRPGRWRCPPTTPRARRCGHRVGGKVLSESGRMLRGPQSEVGEEAGAGHHPRRNHHCVAGNHRAVAHAEVGEVVIDDLQGCHLAVDHADATGSELLGLLRIRRHRVAEVGDVLAPLAEQQRLVGGHRSAGEHADGLVADFPPGAVVAVQHVATPALPHPGHVRQLVDQPGGHQQPSCPQRPAVGQRYREPVPVAGCHGDHPGHQLAAVVTYLRATALHQLGRRDAVVTQQAVHPLGRGVARGASIDHDHRPQVLGQTSARRSTLPRRRRAPPRHSRSSTHR